MADVLLAGAVLLLGALSLLYVHGCATLLDQERDER